MEIKKVKIEMPDGINLICGQTHFIKTAEDLYEVLVNSSAHIKFGIAFCEASGPRLVRSEGNDIELTQLARKNALEVGAGHFFIIFIKDAFPINVLGAVKSCPEVVNIFCATANPVQVLLVEDEQGKGVVGVIDGSAPKGIEDERARKERHDFLRKIGYKL
ncbi:MAG: adenosine-specific kinase [candidate division WOR-3 bacterium]|nr:MAG: adenosine-specific kinase [candidate division WOR-3 bacterium]